MRPTTTAGGDTHMWLAEPDPCDIAAGAAREACHDGGGGGGIDAPAGPADPLTTLARETGRAAAWTVRRLGDAITSPHQIDLTSAEFVRQYALVFAAASVLVLVLWLLAVAQRAARGVPFTEAVTEAVGGLWLAVLCSAFAPLALHLVVGAVHGVTEVLASALGADADDLFKSMANQLKQGNLGGGPLVWLVTGVLTIVTCGALMVVLVLRALSIYVGAVLGVLIFAALVSRDWWSHVRRWAGYMVMLVLMEPVIVIVLGLARTLRADDSHAPVIVGLVATLLTLATAVTLVVKVPGWGDSVRMARTMGRTVRQGGRVVTGAVTAAGGVMQGIHAHGGRAAGTRVNGSPGAAGGPSAGGGGGVSGGMSAHSQRPPRPRNSGGGGGTSGGGGASPPPREGE
ncbi:hypothetical protein ADL27_56920 [Streptomyces sp. NRRL F-6602]|nr:hypothetical protein ADL27_56920 [Streptomyces sp. NRRL F-6602]